MLRRVLICPDTGEDFLFTLKTACLYAKEIDVLTAIDEEWEIILDKTISFSLRIEQVLKEKLDIDSTQPTPAELYRDFVQLHRSDLKMLQDIGLINSLTDRVLQEDRARLNDLLDSTKNLVRQAKPENNVLPPDFENLIHNVPPSFNVLMEAAVEFAVFNFESLAKEFEDVLGNLPDNFFDVFYLVVIQFIQQGRGSKIITNNEYLMSALNSGRLSFPRKRHPTQNLGKQIVEERLPNVQDLSLETILRFRNKFISELEYFWTTLDKLEQSIDPSREPEDQSREMNELIVAEVKPSVAKLRSLIASEKRQIRPSIIQEISHNLVAPTFTFLICQRYGVPLGQSFAASAVSGLVQFLFNSSLIATVRKQSNIDKILAADGFGILLRIEEQLGRRN